MTLTCQGCKTIFNARKSTRKYCARACFYRVNRGVNHSNHRPVLEKHCQRCGDLIVFRWRRSNQLKRRKFCSLACARALHPEQYKNGRVITDGGYIKIRVGNTGRFVYEHRHIMENKLGRKLLTSEHVHHFNGDRQDNREDNLTLVTNAEHRMLHGEASRRFLHEFYSKTDGYGDDALRMVSGC